jgi:ribosomal protein L37AE/L43A
MSEERVCPFCKTKMVLFSKENSHMNTWDCHKCNKQTTVIEYMISRSGFNLTIGTHNATLRTNTHFHHCHNGAEYDFEYCLPDGNMYLSGEKILSGENLSLEDLKDEDIESWIDLLLFR